MVWRKGDAKHASHLAAAQAKRQGGRHSPSHRASAAVPASTGSDSEARRSVSPKTRRGRKGHKHNSKQHTGEEMRRVDDVVAPAGLPAPAVAAAQAEVGVVVPDAAAEAVLLCADGDGSAGGCGVATASAAGAATDPAVATDPQPARGVSGGEAAP